MKYRQISVPLCETKLQAHPHLISLTKNDMVRLKVDKCIKSVPIEVVQTLLDLHPLPVTLNTEGNCYLTLASSNILVRFKAHPLSKKLLLKLHVYPTDAIAHVLRTTLLYNSALTFYLNISLSINIQHRLNCFKEQGMQAPKKNVLANLANTTSSTFR